MEFFQDGQITLDNPILAEDQDEYLDVEIVYSFSGLGFFTIYKGHRNLVQLFPEPGIFGLKKNKGSSMERSHFSWVAQEP